MDADGACFGVGEAPRMDIRNLSTTSGGNVRKGAVGVPSGATLQPVTGAAARVLAACARCWMRSAKYALGIVRNRLGRRFFTLEAPILAALRRGVSAEEINALCKSAVRMTELENDINEAGR